TRRIRCDGVYHRQLRAANIVAAWSPHARRVCDDGAVHLHRACDHLPDVRIQSAEIPPIYSRGDPAGPWHIVIGSGAAAHAGEARTLRVLPFRYRAGDTDGILVQSRRHE